MKPIVKNDWQIYFHPIFFKQWEELVGQVKNLQQKLAKDKFVRHPNVKLIKAIDVAELRCDMQHFSFFRKEVRLLFKVQPYQSMPF